MEETTIIQYTDAELAEICKNCLEACKNNDYEAMKQANAKMPVSKADAKIFGKKKLEDIGFRIFL